MKRKMTEGQFQKRFEKMAAKLKGWKWDYELSFGELTITTDGYTAGVFRGNEYQCFEEALVWMKGFYPNSL